MNWLAFLAFLAGLLEFVVPLEFVGPIFEDLLSVSGATSSWYLLASQAWAVSWACLGILWNAVDQEEDFGVCISGH